MHECVVCDEAVTNPVCPECVEEEIVTWLHEFKPELINELRDVTDEILSPGGSTLCILCKNPMAVCTFCYTQHIKDWLTAYPVARERFHLFFNYGILETPATE